MKTLKRIKLSDLGQDKQMDPAKLIKLKGGKETALFSACVSEACIVEVEHSSDMCEGDGVCKTALRGGNEPAPDSCILFSSL